MSVCYRVLVEGSKESYHDKETMLSPVDAYYGNLNQTLTRFPSSPLIIRVPFFLLFGVNKGTQKEKG